MIKISRKKMLKVLDGLDKEDSWTPGEADISWQRKLFSTGIKTWLCTYAMYEMNHDAKTITLKSVSINGSGADTVSRIRKVCEMIGYKHKVADKVKVYGIMGV